MSGILRWFNSDHLPVERQAVPKLFEKVAKMMDAQFPDSAEKSAGLRKLLEAKDCFVRASVEKSQLELDVANNAHPTNTTETP